MTDTKGKTTRIAERVHWLDVAKGFGIILVVIGHIYKNEIVYNWIYSFHMPLFFFIAGYLYKKKNIIDDIKHRLQTILVPYFDFGVLVLLYWIVFERYFRDSILSIPKAILGLLLGIYSFLDFNVHLWFLPCFFVTVILYNILRNSIGKRVTYIASAFLSMVGVVLNLPVIDKGTLPFCADLVLIYIGFYALGNFFKEKNIFGIISTRSLLLLIGTGELMANFFLTYLYGYKGIYWFVFGMVGVVGICLISIAIRENRILEFYGRSSLIILCIHGPIYRALVKITSLFIEKSTETIREDLFLVILISTLTLVNCSLIYEFVKNKAPWMIGKSKEIIDL